MTSACSRRACLSRWLKRALDARNAPAAPALTLAADTRSASHTADLEIMAKRPMKARFRLPKYVSPRARWRRLIHEAAERALADAGVEYEPHDKLELDVTLYLAEPSLRMHDVDNRLKDIMDALQGRVAGSGKEKPALRPLIQNDSQVYRVIIEKSVPPQQSHGLGHVTVRRYEPKKRVVRRRLAAN